MGESGSLVIIAPFPARELCETPIILTAATFANMLDPQGKLKGEFLKVLYGIEHLLYDKIVA
jgi:hypothetical protein